MQSAEKDSSNLQKEVDKAADHVTKLTERVRKAEAGQIEAQNKLAAAGVESSSARKLVEAVSLLLLPPLYSVSPPFGQHHADFSIHSKNSVLAHLPRHTHTGSLCFRCLIAFLLMLLKKGFGLLVDVQPTAAPAETEHTVLYCYQLAVALAVLLQ